MTKKIQKKKKTEIDTWHAVNSVNSFFFLNGPSGYQTEISERKWVSIDSLNLIIKIFLN